MTKLGLFCERVIEAGWLAAAAAIPLYFNVYSWRVFEPEKATLLRNIAWVVLLAWAIKELERRWGAGSQASAPRETGRNLWQRTVAANPLLLPALLFAALNLLATILSINPYLSLWGSYQRLQGLYTTLCYIALFSAVACHLRSAAQLNRLVTVAILTSVPISLYGIAQHLRLDPLIWGADVSGRVTSAMGNPIFLGAYLIMVVPLTLSRLVAAAQALPQAPRLGVGEELGRLGWCAALLVAQNGLLLVFARSAGASPSLWWWAMPVLAVFVLLGLFLAVPRAGLLLRLAEGVGYGLALGTQLTALFFAQSRGPLLGLLAGVGIFGFALVVRYGSPRLRLATLGALVLAGSFLFLLNLPHTPLAAAKTMPYVGRMAQLWETGFGTGQVRLLIWGGVLDLIRLHPSAGLEPDPLNSLRPLVGYGPETFYFAFNKVFRPELQHLESFQASPDRAHNDLLDYAVVSGLLGLGAYLLVVNLFLFYALALLGLVEPRRRGRVLAVVLVGGVVGLGFYLALLAWRGPPAQGRSPLWQLALAGLLGSVVAHFVESLFGIAIVATRLYLWLGVGMLVGIYHLARQEAEAPAASPATVGAGAELPVRSAVGLPGEQSRLQERRAKKKARRRDFAPQRPAQAAPPVAPAVGWAGSYIVFTLLGWAALAGPLQTDKVEIAFPLSFFWMAVGVMALALALGPTAGWAGRLPSLGWLYAPMAAAAGIVVLFNTGTVAADVYYKRALGYENNRRYSDAIPYYQRALRLAPQEDFYYLKLGGALLEMAKATPAREGGGPFAPDLAAVLRLGPAQLGRLSQKELLEASLVILKEAQRLAPLNADHYVNLARLHRVRAAGGNRQELDTALDYYRRATSLRPSVPQLYQEWASAYHEGGQPQEALARLKKALDIDPKFSLNYVLRGDTYLALQQYDAALADHARALEQYPAALADGRSEQRVQAYIEASHAEGLALAYRQALGRHPKEESFPLHTGLGFLLARTGQEAEALPHFEAGAKLNPKDWLTQRNLALLYGRQGAPDKALAAAQEALKYAPPQEAADLKKLIASLKQPR